MINLIFDLCGYMALISVGIYALLVFCIKVDLGKANVKTPDSEIISIGKTISTALKFALLICIPVFNIVYGIFAWWNYEDMLQGLIKDYEQSR